MVKAIQAAADQIVDYPVRAGRAKPVVEELIETKKARTKGAIQRALAKSADPLVVLKGITEAYTAEEVTELLYCAELFALEQKSWEGILAILKLALEYSVGKPVQRSVSATFDMSKFADGWSDKESEG